MKHTKNNLETLAKISDVVITQETKTLRNSSFYSELLIDFLPFHNPNPDSDVRAGTDMFINRELAKGMTLTHRIIVPGYVQALELVPVEGKEQFFTNSFTILNAYIPVKQLNNEVIRLSVLEAIRGYDGIGHKFFGGDWNLVLRSEDSSSGKHYSSSKKVTEAFRKILEKHKLEEVFQPHHTCVRSTSSSRLDRWYINHDVPDRCLMEPETTIPQHPHMPGKGKLSGPTDHFPVRLAFYQPHLSRGVRYRIPDWIAKHPLYHKKLREEFGKVQLDNHPIRDLLSFKKCCKGAAKTVKEELSSMAALRAASLTRSIGTFRQLKAGAPVCVVKEKIRSDHALSKAVSLDTKSQSEEFPYLRKHISKTLFSNPLANPRTGRFRSFLREAKSALPHEKTHLTHLLHEGKLLDTSSPMAKALKQVWTPMELAKPL